jgi:hypothetical protein
MITDNSDSKMLPSVVVSAKMTLTSTTAVCGGYMFAMVTKDPYLPAIESLKYGAAEKLGLIVGWMGEGFQWLLQYGYL